MAARGVRLPAGVLALALLTPTSCTLALRRQHDQCQTSEDCQALAAGAVCSQDGVCERLQSPEPAVAGAQSCRLDADCTDDPWSLCRQGSCYALDTLGCIPLGAAATSSSSDRLAVGVLLPAAEIQGSTRGVNFIAAAIAIGELNPDLSTFKLPGIAAVACDEDDPAARENLLLAGVSILIGPMQAESIDGARAAANGRALFFGPYADAPDLDPPPLGPTSSLVSCKPNRAASKASFLAAVSFVQDQLRNLSKVAADSSAVFALSDTEQSLGFDLYSQQELEAASLVTTTYQSAQNGLATALQRQSLVPSLLVAPSDVNDWSQNIADVDNAVQTTGEYPYYLLSDKQSPVLALVADVNASTHPQYERVFSLDYRAPGNSDANANADAVHLAFSAAFQKSSNMAFTEGLDYVRDCVYLATYAAVSAELRFSLSAGELSPEAVLIGLNAMIGGGRALTTKVGDIDATLVALQTDPDGSAAVSLTGGSGPLDLEGLGSVEQIAADPARQYIRPNPRDQALYCINLNLGQGFTSPQVTFSAAGMVTTPDAEEAFASCLAGTAQ